MNGLQRFQALEQNQLLDKIPLRVGNYNVFMAEYYDIGIQEYLRDPQANASAFVDLVNEFNFDSIKPGLGYIFYGCGPETGVTWSFPEDNFPAATKGIVNTIEDISRISIPDEPIGYFKKFIEINLIAKKFLGDKTQLGISILGPFSVAAFFRGFEKLLMDMITDIGFFNEQMDKCSEFSVFLGSECLKLQHPWSNLMEIFLVPGVVNPDQYHSLIATYDDRVCSKLSNPPLSNYLSIFMGHIDDPESHKEGKKISDYYFGIKFSIEAIRSIQRHIKTGFPKLISLSGNALVHSSQNEILEFIKRGLDYFVFELQTAPYIYLPSIQAENKAQAKNVAEKLKRINEKLFSYVNTRKGLSPMISSV